MDIVEDPVTARSRLDGARAAGRSVGFVATMGSLHDGHRSLIRRSKATRDLTAVSVFVNPLQFGPGEDLAGYPRSLDDDAAMAEGEGVDLMFAPAVEAMYPGDVATLVRVRGLSEDLEGRSRPGHLEGVTTVVAKLFNLVGPCHAFFGEKDYQQLIVVRQMVRDLSIPVTIVECPTVRHLDGLALSSRNTRLDAAQRRAATVLSRALELGAAAVEGGETDAKAIEAMMAAVIAAEQLAELDYAVVRDPSSLTPVGEIRGTVRLLVAARVGAARLIDNCGASPPARGR